MKRQKRWTKKERKRGWRGRHNPFFKTVGEYTITIRFTRPVGTGGFL